MVYIYTLKLQEGKYYIGKTHNPQFRLDCHFNLNGSKWTKKYKPLKVIELKNNCDDYDEDKITMQYMDKYGINNVRGGSFVSFKLKKSSIDTLKQMSNGRNNNCFICGKKDHFAKDCEQNNYYETDSSDSEIDSSDSDKNNDDSEFVFIKNDKKYKIWCCEYCGKEIDNNRGDYLFHGIFCSKKNIKNKKTKKYDYKSIDYNHSNCFRCGRKGHYSSSCYASKHIKGYYLD
jgi:hypothetical protein